MIKIDYKVLLIFITFIVLYWLNYDVKLCDDIDGDLLLKKENSGKMKKIKANEINFDQNIDDIQTAEEVKSDNDVISAVGDEVPDTPISSYDKIVRYILFLIFKTLLKMYLFLLIL